MSEEWGPWIEHDGKGCPCVGEWVEMEWALSDDLDEGIAGSRGGQSWVWVKGILSPDPYDFGAFVDQITRYRIRKPKGLTMLERAARDVTAPIEQVGA